MPVIPQPGVEVQERLAPARTPSSGNQTVTALVGTCRRGPTYPTVVRSWTEFTKHFGAFEGDHELPFAAYNFYNNGGRNLYVARVVASAAAKANAILMSGGATPEPALEVEAANPGAWANEVYVEIYEGADVDTFDMLVYNGGDSAADLSERFLGLSQDENDSRFAELVVNSTRSGSKLIRVTVPGGADVPDETTSPEPLTGGSDGGTPAVSTWEKTIEAFDVVTNPVAMNLPGVSEANKIAAAIQYAETRSDIFVVVDPGENMDPDEVVAWADALPNSSRAAVYYPWVEWVDPSANSLTTTRTGPPGGAVLGQYARTDQTRGVWKAPAGLDTRLSGAIALKTPIDGVETGKLNHAHVNPLRHQPGSGITIHGTRTLRKTNQADRTVPVRRTLIYLSRSLQDLFQFAVFETNDENTWAAIRAEGGRFLTSIWTHGGLRGETAEDAFYVKCDGELNDETALEQGILNVEVGVALQRPAEFVVVTLSQWQGGVAAGETL